MFHLGGDRSRRSSCGAIMRYASDRSEVFRLQTTSHGLLLRVYASQWNWGCTAFERVETKTEEVVFSRRSWLSFIVGVRSELVRSYDRHLPEVLPWLKFTPDPQQVQAERFSLKLCKRHKTTNNLSILINIYTQGRLRVNTTDTD